MTPEEFAAARKTLGWTQDQMASELNLTPHVIAAIEKGEARIPRSIAKNVAWMAAAANADAVMAASGLPECPTLAAFVGDVNDKPDVALKKIEALEAHMKTCPICQAREAYGRAHIAPLPEMPMPAWIKGFGFLEDALGHLPKQLRPPEGDAGEGRRRALWVAAFFSLIAIGVSSLMLIGNLVSDGLSSRWWQQPLAIMLAMPCAYFVGLFLAGTIYDLTRPIASRLPGYVIRGALCVPAAYGSVGAVIPLFDDKITWSDWPVLTAMFAVLGAVGGAVLWVVHKVRGKIPGQAS
jgi:DNA-binding XRE family transcriptional regulator